MDVARQADSPEPPSTPPSSIATDPARAAPFLESATIMARLRAPDGCPWDREQTFDTIRKYTLEEAYEVFDAIERRDFPHLAEELGDLLLQVLFYAEMAANEGRFTIADVLDSSESQADPASSARLRRRSFARRRQSADVDANVEGSATQSCATGKRSKPLEAGSEGAREQGSNKRASSRLDSVLRAMPALAEAAKLGVEGAKSGFDWPTWRGLLPKIVEETAELEAEATLCDDTAPQSGGRSRTGRSAVYRRQPRPSSRRGCGDGPARLQSAFPPALSARWNKPRRVRSKNSPRRTGSALGRSKAQTRNRLRASKPQRRPQP